MPMPEQLLDFLDIDTGLQQQVLLDRVAGLARNELGIARDLGR